MNRINKIVNLLLENEEMNQKISELRQIIAQGFVNYKSSLKSIERIRQILKDDPTGILKEYVWRFEEVWKPIEKQEGHFRNLILGVVENQRAEQIFSGGKISEGEYYTDWVNEPWYSDDKSSPRTIKDICEVVAQDERFQNAKSVFIDHFEDESADDAGATFRSFGGHVTPKYVNNFIPSNADSYHFNLNGFINYIKENFERDTINFARNEELERYMSFFEEKYPFVQHKIIYEYNNIEEEDFRNFDLNSEDDYDFSNYEY